MDIEQIKAENGIIVKLSGRMDATTAPHFEKQCGVLVDQGVHRLAVDFTGLEYISSAGLRSILTIGKKLKASGGALCLCSMSGMVKEVFDISGFTGIFPVFVSPESALENP